MSIYTYQKEAGLMNLEKLIQAREEVKPVRFPIQEQRLPERHDALYTGAVNGVLREFCLLEQALPATSCRCANIAPSPDFLSL